MALAVFATASGHAQSLFATGVTAPGGGIVLSGTAINIATGKPYRHLWTSDTGGFGLCRLDPAIDSPGPKTINPGTCIPFVDGVQFKPGQFAFDPVLNNIYAVDMQANSRGIIRLHFLPTGSNGLGAVDPVHIEILGGSNISTRNGLPGCGIAGNVPNSAVLGPDGNLYIGFKASGDILRVRAPQIEPLPCENVELIGSTPDGRKDFGLGFISHDLFGGDGLSAWVIPNADQCFTPANGNTPCHGTNILTAQTAVPQFVMSDQLYPAVNGRNLFVGSATDITLVDTASFQVTPRFAAGFQFLSGMALDPTNLDLFVADDPSNGLINGQGRWWFLGNKGGFIGQQTLVDFADNVTASGGGIVLPGSGINPNTGKPYRHLWNGDSGGFGLCRLDPDLDTPGLHAINAATCLPFVAGVQFKPGEMAFDPTNNNLYVVDMQANTKGIFRLHFAPDGDNGHGAIDPIHQEVLAGNGAVGHNGLPACGIAGNVPNSAVLGPDGNLYIGFKRSGDLLRINAPQTEPLPCANVVVVGTTPDHARDMGLGWIGHDLFGGDGRAAFVIPHADQCMTRQNGNFPCASNNILAGSTAAPTAVISDQIYPAVNGRNLLVGQPGSITLINPASLQVTQNYVTGFQLLSALALDPTNLELYVADDASAGLLPQQGHWYETIPLQVTPAAPGAPVGVFATAGNASATVQWTPAPDGQTITSYLVRNSFVSAGSPVSDVLINPAPGSTVVATSVNIGGLSNGVSYQFEVAAVDAVGTSPFSAPSNTVTPFVPSVPLPPTNIVAVAHDSSATVQWTGVPDYQNGGFPIQVYKVEVEIDGVETGQVLDVSPLFNTATVPGLNNGTTYTFVVVATNQIGDSALSLPSNAVTPAAASPAAVPGEPTLVTAVAGNASATVNWTAPVSDGGSPITGYMIVPLINNSPTVLSNVVPAPATSATITGLINGNTYTFIVSAINAAGKGAGSAPSNAVTPFAPAPSPVSGVPGVPTLVHAIAGVNSASVSWIAPAITGSGVTSYNVVALVGGTPVGTSVTVPAPVTGGTITNLIAGTTYTFVVHAINAAGDSGASAPSNAVTPSAAATAPGTAPGLPTGISAIAGNASATVSWLAPASDGGSPILKYNVVAFAAGAPAGISLQIAPPALNAVVSGLTNGTVYTFVVHAINAIGDSGASAASNGVTPVAANTSGNANLSVTITGPSTSPVGANAAFTLVVTNIGATAVPKAMVQDIFSPSAGSLVSHISSQGTCTEAFASLDCNLGTIAVGGTATVSFTIKITATLQNRAVAEALDASGQRIPSSSPAQSTVSLSTAVSTPVSVSTTADLQISGTSVGTGAQTTVVWLISNAQAQPANAVKFIDQLPSALQFVSVNTSAGVNCTAPTSSGGGVLACALDVLPGGQGILIAVTANVSAAAALPIANSAKVSFSGIDSNAANNSSTVNIGPAPAPAPPGNPAPAPAPGGGGTAGGGGNPSGGTAAVGGQPTGGRGAVCAPPAPGARGGAAAHTGEGGLLSGACGGA
jgi:hypothetical protein